MLRLLVVTAHPDDEAASFGGTLLLYRERGVETHVLCLTPGQAATHRGSTRGDEELAATRREEFAAACRILRVSHAEVLNYRDAALATTDFYTAVADLTQRMRDICPHVVLTYGAEGSLTGHPDHGMAGIIATMAYHWAGRTNIFPDQLTNGRRPWRAQKLYYGTTLFTLPDRQPISLSPATACISVKQYFDLKIQAFKQHTTQAPLFPLFERNVSGRGHEELFHLAASVTPRKLEWETDLFADVKEELS